MKQYLLSIHRRLNTDPQPDYEFYWRLKRLDTGDVTEATTDFGANLPTNPGIWRLGHASTHFYHLQGPMIIHNNETQTHVDNSRSWLEHKWAGTTTSAEGATESTSDPASFFVNLNILQSQRNK